MDIALPTLLLIIFDHFGSLNIVVLFFSAANSKRSGLLYMHSFHKTIDGQNSDMDPRDSDLDQPQSLAKQTDSLQDAVQKESNPVGDVPQSQTLSEPKDIPPHSCSKTELQQGVGEHQAVESAADLVNREIPLNTSTITSMRSDDSNNIPVPVSGIVSTSTEDPNPLSPFIPKKDSLEEDQNMISDLINFSDSPRTKAADTDVAPIKTRAEATPPVEVQPVEETNHVILCDRKLSSLRQPSLESDQSAVVCIVCLLKKKSIKFC